VFDFDSVAGRGATQTLSWEALGLAFLGMLTTTQKNEPTAGKSVLCLKMLRRLWKIAKFFPILNGQKPFAADCADHRRLRKIAKFSPQRRGEERKLIVPCPRDPQLSNFLNVYTSREGNYESQTNPLESLRPIPSRAGNGTNVDFFSQQLCPSPKPRPAADPAQGA